MASRNIIQWHRRGSRQGAWQGRVPASIKAAAPFTGHSTMYPTRRRPAAPQPPPSRWWPAGTTSQFWSNSTKTTHSLPPPPGFNSYDLAVSRLACLISQVEKLLATFPQAAPPPPTPPPRAPPMSTTEGAHGWHESSPSQLRLCPPPMSTTDGAHGWRTVPAKVAPTTLRTASRTTTTTTPFTTQAPTHVAPALALRDQMATARRAAGRRFSSLSGTKPDSLVPPPPCIDLRPQPWFHLPSVATWNLIPSNLSTTTTTCTTHRRLDGDCSPQRKIGDKVRKVKKIASDYTCPFEFLQEPELIALKAVSFSYMDQSRAWMFAGVFHSRVV